MVKSVLLGNAPTPTSSKLTEDEKAELRAQGLNPDDYEVVETPEQAQDFDPAQWEEIDPRTIEKEVAPSIRLEVGGLTTPEDRLTALKRHYADAMPVGEDNFVMTDEDGSLLVYNREGWMPSWGDVAEAVPEAGGILGSIGGAAAGGVLGTAASPGFGNLAGAIAGGGLGYGAGKGAVRDVVNWGFGNEDTRDTGEKVKDFAIDTAVGAAGEGLGRGAMFVGGKALGALGRGKTAIGDSARRTIMGGSADDATLAAERLATFENAGVQPTPGMIGGDRLATTELARSKGSTPYAEGVDRVRDSLNSKWTEAVDGIGLGERQTVDSTGALIRDGVDQFGQTVKQRSDDLFQKVATDTDGINAIGTNTAKFNDDLAAEYAKASQSSKLRIGPTYEKVLERTKAMAEDVSKGTSFNNLKEARSEVGSLLQSATTPAERNILNRYYAALTNDMTETAASAGAETSEAFKKANSQYVRRKGATGLISDKAINNVIRDTRSDASVYSLLTSATKTNAKLANQIITQVRTVGGDDAVREISSSIFSKMGQRGDTFDAAKLLREWDGLSPEGRSTLFSFKGGAEIRTQMDRVIEAQRELQKYLKNGNHSNTAKALTSSVKDTNNVVQVGTAIATGGGSVPYQAAYFGSKFLFDRARKRMFENPQTLRWLAGLPKQKNPSKYLQALQVIGERTVDQALKIEIRDYLKDVSGAI